MSKHSSTQTESSLKASFEKEVTQQFIEPLEIPNLLRISQGLNEEFKKALKPKEMFMVPCYHYRMPLGDQRRILVTVDIGGSVLRIAKVELIPRGEVERSARVLIKRCWPMDDLVKAVPSAEFFRWVALKIKDAGFNEGSTHDGPDELSLAWSFPLECEPFHVRRLTNFSTDRPRSHTSSPIGKIIIVAKGFEHGSDFVGRDLGLLMEDAYKEVIGRSAKVLATVNDAAATLLAGAHVNSSTKIGLVHGTGVNAAIELPVSVLGPEKFGPLPPSWKDNAPQNVLVDTELSMYGKNVLPRSSWDDILYRLHALPGFQPLEYLIGGRYLGEIVRLIVMDAVDRAGLLDGRMPEKLQEPFSLETEILAGIECDDTLSTARAIFTTDGHKVPPEEDLHLIRYISQCVSRRAAAYLASALHALWTLYHDSKYMLLSSASPITAGCHGSVILKYPGLRDRCQKYLDELTVQSGGLRGSVNLEPAPDATLLGTAVAAAYSEI